jgi:hypothetical protein
MPKMDPLDRLLSQLPAEAPANDLARRISHHVRARRHRAEALRFGASLVLGLTGAWLCLPLFTSLPASVSVPGSGIPLAYDWIQAALTNLAGFLSSAWNGVTGVQSGMAASINASVWVGLAVLAVGALLAVLPMLQQADGFNRKGI